MQYKITHVSTYTPATYSLHYQYIAVVDTDMGSASFKKEVTVARMDGLKGISVTVLVCDVYDIPATEDIASKRDIPNLLDFSRFPTYPHECLFHQHLADRVSFLFYCSLSFFTSLFLYMYFLCVINDRV